MPRRLTSVTVLATAAAATAVLAGGLLGAGTAGATSATGAAPRTGDPVHRLPGAEGRHRVPPARIDQLTFTVRHSGVRAMDGTYRLECDPPGGDHPHAKAACRVLEAASTSGEHPFRPVPADSNCTRVYGGPATAHVVGIWHGREVDAHFSRTNGCEIARWNRLVPALPKPSTWL